MQEDSVTFSPSTPVMPPLWAAWNVIAGTTQTSCPRPDIERDMRGLELISQPKRRGGQTPAVLKPALESRMSTAR